ncbi:lipoprotein amino terminal region domain-containing protein [Ditylenchus destructor]|uniref:Lipoprotein amino terminal region domain-containing protein n=1 Tax=Ditylenchus destructor TaxID=166010 RepID=A0AAD4R3R3_9BILA|nr:lipoprotein amino terminal region domain-containing protein [Ditylenchus destructor]
MKATTLVALVLLAGLCTASHKTRRYDNDDSQQSQTQKAKPFRAGRDYSFVYNGQIASGLDVSGPNNAPTAGDEPQQNAVTRIKANAKIAFETDQRATLRLENIRLGQLNQQIESPQQMQPMSMFERKEVEQEKREKLQIPLQFTYNDGVVERIQFQAQDPIWSKNIKRAVLNLIQLNLNRQQIPGSNQQQSQSWPLYSAEQEHSLQSDNEQSAFQTFTVPEITIEGECETTYTISKNKQQQEESSIESNRQQSQDEQCQSGKCSQSFNVTKTIDFRKCNKIADVAYGYQTQQQQPQCAKCRQNQQQAQKPQPRACSQECDPKEIKEQNLDRSTAARFVLAGKGPQQEYGIKRAELVSQYTYKNLRANSGAHASTMHTVVVAELIFQSSQPSQQQVEFQADPTNQKDTLLYDNDWDVEEKRFYMNGDEDYSNNSPFAKVEKVEQAQQKLKFLIRAASDKNAGIETTEAMNLQRLVEVLRMCSVQELNKIYQHMSDNAAQSSQRTEAEQQKVEQILADTLAIAGTRNTMQVLAEKIKSGDIKPNQAVQSLKQLSGLPAPSDNQADIVLNLCQHENVRRNQALKQTCLLTFGSVVGELCQQKTQQQDKTVAVFGAQSGFHSSRQCASAKKETFKQALVSEFKQAQNPYEKILALKALGNAAIDTSAQSLEQIIGNQRENPIVRANAIDALRRLRTKMSRKIQRILLPVLQNTRDHPAVRMTAFALIMQTSPEQPILDQVAYTLAKERNPQVQSLVYTALKSLSQSNAPGRKQNTEHLKNILKLANIDEQQLQASRFYQFPIYSNEQKEGVLINLMSVFFNRNGVLPNYLAAAMDTILNDEFDVNSVRAELIQQGVEQWYENIIQAVLKEQTSNVRGKRSSRNRNTEELRKVYSGLNAQPRRSSNRQEQDESEYSEQQPMALLTVRVGDVDTTIVPITSQNLPACLQQLVNGQRPSISDCINSEQGSQSFRSLRAMNLNERSVKIPTTMGLPLRILQTTPVLATIEGHIQPQSSGMDGAIAKANINVHPSICVVHLQKMGMWSPMVATGVQSVRGAELNVPINADLQLSSQGQIRGSLKTPAQPTQLLGLHSLPSTYTREYDSDRHQHREPKVKAVHIPQLEQLQRDVDHVCGKNTLGMPIRIQGHFHQPSDITDYRQLVQMAMCSENHIHIRYEPTPESPKEIILRAEPASFSKVSQRQSPKLDNFYSKTSPFDSPEEEFDQLEGHEQRRARLNTFLNKFQPSLYKHSMKLSAETKGGRKQVKAQMTASASCDAKFKYCRMEVDAERTPMLEGENSEWTLNSKLQILVPESVSNVQQLQQQRNAEDEKHHKLMVFGETEWGSEHKQQITFRVQGEKAHTKHWRNQISQQFQGPQQKFQEKQAAFLNKFDLVADYKLRAPAENFFQRCLEVIKGYGNFWNTESELRENGSERQVTACLIIDPLTQEHANVSVKTPNQVVRIRSMELPVKARPFALVRPNEKSSHSAVQLMSRLAMGKGRAECSVDGKRVDTFDDVHYKAPIGKCYSVLAKDCTNEQPQFAVMMKTIGDNQDKKIKVITADQLIECKPTQDSASGQKKLECTVNSQIVDPSNEGNDDNSYSQTVEFNNDDQTDVTINVEGVQVRFGCWGSQSCKNQKAWIKISSQYKEGQCGLCGHYDDKEGDELRMPNNKQADDLKQFHRSYSLRDDDCSKQDQEDLYSQTNNQKFREGRRDTEDYSSRSDEDEENVFDPSQANQKIAKKNAKNMSWQQDDETENEEESQWQAGAYHSDESSRLSFVQCEAQQEQQAENDDNDDAPVPVTKVLEYIHHICFSTQAVNQCPPGTYADSDRSNQKKVQFACLSRSDPQVRQMQRQGRRGVVVEMSKYQPSFVEPIQVPTRCVVY